jgi:hypothetical protein
MTKTSTARKPATSKAEFPTIEAVRAYTADTISGFKTSPLTRYEAGLQQSFEEFGNMLHPAGYHGARSRGELIAGLRKPPTKSSVASLQNIKAVRDVLDRVLKGIADDPAYPFDDRFLCGLEDAHWLLLGLVYPEKRAAALRTAARRTWRL